MKTIRISGKRFLESQNKDVISKLRKTGLFRTDAEVVDAALRALDRQLKSEFADMPETADLPAETPDLPSLPDTYRVPAGGFNPGE